MSLLIPEVVQSTPLPPNTAALGTGEKNGGYWKTPVKGVIYNQEQTYSGL